MVETGSRRAIGTAEGLTHLLLATLVAGSLDAGLALLIIVAVLILVAAAWAALEVCVHAARASLSLVGAVAVAGAGRACRALSGGPPAGDRGSVHAAPSSMDKVMEGNQSSKRSCVFGSHWSGDLTIGEEGGGGTTWAECGGEGKAVMVVCRMTRRR